MLNEYLFYLLITLLTSQTLKYLFKISRDKRSIRQIKKIYFYYSGPPSSHSAVISMSYFYFKDRVVADSVFMSSFVLFALFWLYEIFMQRNRFNNLVRLVLIKESKGNTIKINKEFHGHAFIDIFLGLLLGSLMFFLLNIL